MPCSDGRSDNIRTEIVYRESRELAAAMCGVMHALGKTRHIQEVLNNVDWKEAGISRTWLEGWWERHRAADASRKAAERKRAEEKRRKEELRKSAISKLTPAERKELGL